MKDKSLPKMAAVVCREVAIDRFPILCAERSRPEDEADSGWQFLCGKDTEDSESAQIWAIGEVLSLDQSLLEYIELPVGTVLTRSSQSEGWRVSNKLADGNQ